MTINGKSYVEVGKHVIYYLFKVSCSSAFLLVNRGAIVGVASNSVRVIATPPDGTVDIYTLITMK